MRIWPNPAQSTITFTTCTIINTNVQHIISFFKAEVYTAFKSQNISLTTSKQQLRKVPGELQTYYCIYYQLKVTKCWDIYWYWVKSKFINLLFLWFLNLNFKQNLLIAGVLSFATLAIIFMCTHYHRDATVSVLANANCISCGWCHTTWAYRNIPSVYQLKSILICQL